MALERPLSLYVHVPFCTLKCSYCDFNSYANLEHLMPAFTEALIAEARLWGPQVSGCRVDTVFFGGGTPSLMPLSHLERIIGALRDSFDIARDGEVSLEANPGTVDGHYLRGLRQLGVDRLSFGVQSFHDDELAALDRIHSADEARQGYRQAREAGFERINLDLIYGLPEQPLPRWRESVAEALRLTPEHLSLYALTVEEGTKLAHDIERGITPGPDLDLQASMYEWSRERLAAAGYVQYEISNWARPGEECRHNLAYWRNGEWLGLGPGAHSHLQNEDGTGLRCANLYSPKQYIERLSEAARSVDSRGDIEPVVRSMPQVQSIEAQTVETEMADTAILGLRLNEGLAADEFERRFGRPFEDMYGGVLSEMTSLGLLERADGHVRLTDRGRYLANEVFVRLLP